MSNKAATETVDEHQVEELENVQTSVIFEVIRREGKHELSRPTGALWWSGVAAGLAISTSVLCKGLLAIIDDMYQTPLEIA